MVSQRKRHLFFGLGLVVALVLAVGTSSAVAAVSTLSGEELSASGGPGAVACQTGGPYSYTVSGTASGPYPGTFTETGSGMVNSSPGPATLSASFTITSPTTSTTITGTKNGGPGGLGCQDLFGPNTAVGLTGLSYQATLHTSTGNFADRGTSDVVRLFTGPSGTTLDETFTSSLGPVFAPTSKDQCKNGGWATSTNPVYKNQGECVSHFASGK